MKVTNSTILLSFILVLCLWACEEENKDIHNKEIKVGQGELSLDEVKLNPQNVKKIVLSGGNGKFKVSVENGRLVAVKMLQDTLQIKSFELEGETFATIYSHNKKRYLDIKVVPNELNFSADKVLLHPSDINKSVALGGGGRIVELEEIDPLNIMDVKWNGETRIIEIFANYEGEATIIAKCEGVASKELKVSIKCEDEKKYLNEIGVYLANRVSIGQIINPVLKVRRKEMGTLISGTTSLGSYEGNYVIISPIKLPVEGEDIEIDFLYASGASGLSEGAHKYYVEKVNALRKIVELRGRGVKLVLPFE